MEKEWKNRRLNQRKLVGKSIYNHVSYNIYNMEIYLT